MGAPPARVITRNFENSAPTRLPPDPVERQHYVNNHPPPLFKTIGRDHSKPPLPIPRHNTKDDNPFGELFSSVNKGHNSPVVPRRIFNDPPSPTRDYSNRGPPPLIPRKTVTLTTMQDIPDRDTSPPSVASRQNVSDEEVAPPIPRKNVSLSSAPAPDKERTNDGKMTPRKNGTLRTIPKQLLNRPLPVPIGGKRVAYTPMPVRSGRRALPEIPTFSENAYDDNTEFPRIGSKVKAQYWQDGNWYQAVVKRMDSDPIEGIIYQVIYEGYPPDLYPVYRSNIEPLLSDDIAEISEADLRSQLKSLTAEETEDLATILASAIIPIREQKKNEEHGLDLKDLGLDF
eukprot:TRINITY_DN4760_c0_g1_i3.p1 TRINITY_DN4760_c0_g1~~TRINITY_DN4760_c0_g1_i3.p1  ORF type:complete len:343 (-),score=75.71 TRINITY_DN4760_c0_g1_i3:52-1080(-)